MGRNEKDLKPKAEFTPTAAKKTIADFLAAAGAMDESVWESAWDEAVEHVADVAAGASLIIFPGHYAAEGAPLAGESGSSSLMEVLLADALAMASAGGGWPAIARRTWTHALTLIARAWGGRLVGECVERFRVALGVFAQRGEVAIDLAQGPGEGTSVLWIRAGLLELAEEAAEQMAPWFARYLCEQRIPCERRRMEVDDVAADGAARERRFSCRITARIS